MLRVFEMLCPLAWTRSMAQSESWRVNPPRSSGGRRPPYVAAAHRRRRRMIQVHFPQRSLEAIFESLLLPVAMQDCLVRQVLAGRHDRSVGRKQLGVVAAVQPMAHDDATKCPSSSRSAGNVLRVPLPPAPNLPSQRRPAHPQRRV